MQSLGRSPTRGQVGGLCNLVQLFIIIPPTKALILQGLLTMCCFSQLSLLTEQLATSSESIRSTVLPREVSLKVLTYLDATSLCRAAQVTKHWRSLADDDVLWRGICEQHIVSKM